LPVEAADWGVEVMELEDECTKLTRTDCTEEGALADLLAGTEGEVEEAEEEGALAGLSIKSKGLG
jgi:hypothetical protein